MSDYAAIERRVEALRAGLRAVADAETPVDANRIANEVLMADNKARWLQPDEPIE